MAPKNNSNNFCWRNVITLNIKTCHLSIIFCILLIVTLWMEEIVDVSEIQSMINQTIIYYNPLNITSKNVNTSSPNITSSNNILNDLTNDFQVQLNESQQLINNIKIELRHKNMENEELTKKIADLMSKIGTEKDKLLTKLDYDKFFQSEYIEGYDHWIRGLGDTKLLNNISGSNCLYRSVPYKLSHAQAYNGDVVYNVKRDCVNRRFSQIYNRILLVKCNTKPTYFESESIFHGNRPSQIMNTSKVRKIENKNKESNIYIVSLANNTQTVWVKCNKQRNHHFALLPLNELNNDLYVVQQNKLNKHFSLNKAPNIIIFVMDSTSRSCFIRSSIQCVEYLSGLLRLGDHSPVKIFQHFRYSTIAWGTGHNLGALVGGRVISKVQRNNIMGLAEYYDNLGYYVPGFDELRKLQSLNDNTKAVKWAFESDYYLSYNVFTSGRCEKSGYFDIESAADFALQLNIHNINIPHFAVLHTQSNHRSEAKFMFTMDYIVRNLLENIDKKNTILHIIADHGTYQVGNIFGEWETTNPVSIQLIPNNLFINNKNTNNSVLDYNILKINEQRLISHYDMFQFYRELPYKISNKIVGNDKILNYKKNITKWLPRTTDSSPIISKSIIDEEIEVNRSCNSIRSKFCFCNVFKKIKPNPIKDEKYIQLIIETINNLTGNGYLKCNKLSSSSFNVTMHLLATDGSNKFEIEQSQNSLGINKNEYIKLQKEYKILKYSATIKMDHIVNVSKHKSLIPDIKRLSYFKYEKCLTTEYDFNHYSKYHQYFTQQLSFGDSPEPVFIHKNITIKMLKSQQIWNLRLCSCKS